MRPANSGGPNLSAAHTIRGAISMIIKVPKVPAIKEPKAAMPKAGPARPFRAIWYPSRQVTTEADSPGILTRIDVVEPPYMAP